MFIQVSSKSAVSGCELHYPVAWLALPPDTGDFGGEIRAPMRGSLCHQCAAQRLNATLFLRMLILGAFSSRRMRLPGAHSDLSL